MSEMLREVCMSAIFIALLLSITPEGSAKRIARLCSAAVLCLIIMGGVGGLNFEAYALSAAEYDAQAEKMKSTAMDASVRMNRLVIEQQCESYIMDKAAELGVEVHEAKVLAMWSREGVWVPQSVKLSAAYSKELSEQISAQLGIAPEKQEWEDGEAETDIE